MYGLNAFALIILALIVLFARSVCRRAPADRLHCLHGVCLLLLLGNILRYTLLTVSKGSLVFPVEFSAVSYFVVPLIFLLKRKELYSLASYAGMTAGSCYYLTMILAGGRIYGAQPPYDVYLSLLFHGALLFCGMVTYDIHGETMKSCYKQLLGIGAVAVRAALLRGWVEAPEGMLIYILLDRTPLQWLGIQLGGIGAAAYYAVLAGLVVLSLLLFYRAPHKKFSHEAKMNINVYANIEKIS